MSSYFLCGGKNGAQIKVNPSLQVVDHGEVFELQGSATGRPSPFSFHWALETPNGSGASLSDVEGDVSSFAPDVPGTYKVTMTALSSMGHSAEITRDIYFGEQGNKSPIPTASPAEILIEKGGEGTSEISANDPDNNSPFSFRAEISTSLGTASITRNGSKAMLRLRPASGVTSGTISVLVKDSGNPSAEGSVLVPFRVVEKVSDLNAVIVGPQEVLADSMIALSGLPSIGGPETYRWTVTPNNVEDLQGENSSELSFRPVIGEVEGFPFPQTYKVTLTITKGSSSSSTSHYVTAGMRQPMVKALEKPSDRYSQGSGWWRDLFYDHSPSKFTLQGAGCLITAYSMILKSFGVEIPVPGTDAKLGTDPGYLNAVLRTLPRFAVFNKEGNIEPTNMATYLGKEFNLTESRKEWTDPSNVSGIQTEIDTELKAGRPVVVGIPGFPKNYRADKGGCGSEFNGAWRSAGCVSDPRKPNHYVVVYGYGLKKVNGVYRREFLIHDPGSGVHRTLGDIAYLVAGGSRENVLRKVKSTRTFQQAQLLNDSVLSGISLSTTKKVALLVRDQAGRRTGEDLYAEEPLKEIPGSEYDGAGLADPTGQTDGLEPSSQIGIASSSHGIYTIEIRASEEVSDRLSLVQFGSDGLPNRVEVVPYTVRPNEPFTRQIEFTPTPASHGNLAFSVFEGSESRFKIRGQITPGGESNGFNPSQEGLTLVFDGGGITETIPAEQFLAMPDGYLYTNAGTGINRAFLSHSGQLEIESNTVGSIGFAPEEWGSSAAIYVGDDTFYGVVPLRERAETNLIRLKADKEFYHVGEKSTLTATTKVTPRPGEDALLEVVWNGRVIKTQDLSEDGLVSAVSPPISGGSIWEVRYLLRDGLKARMLNEAIDQQKGMISEAEEELRRGPTRRRRDVLLGRIERARSEIEELQIGLTSLNRYVSKSARIFLGVEQ